MTSRSSFDSLDHLWADERRLSEAGVRRYSTDSNPLYNLESTDSFIIGDPVFVNGMIPGRIAYIGETKFGPGDWAGIVLDEASGKNDGTVGGFRYFQCEPKHGIFSRLNRLTRYPLHPSDRSTSRTSSVDEGRISPFKKSSYDGGLFSSRPLTLGDRPTSRNSSLDEGRISPFKKSSFEGIYSSRKSSTDGGLFSRGFPESGGLFSRKSSGDSYSGRKSAGSYHLESSPQRFSTGHPHEGTPHHYGGSPQNNYDHYGSSPGTTSSGDGHSGRKSSESNSIYGGRESPSRYYSSEKESPPQRFSTGYPTEGTPHHFGGSRQNTYDHYGSSPPATRKKSQPNELRVGDRVIIRSSQGSKSGVLKFKGDTYFASGQWCGVELDDPLGKNDGSVDGHRYFYCEPKFGVFAPTSKVSKSPVQGTGHASKNCAVHPSKDIPIVSTIVKEVKPAPGSRPFMDKTTTIVYEKKVPRGAKAVTQIHQIKGYNHSWDADCY